jgi:hypothetical protein
MKTCLILLAACCAWMAFGIGLPLEAAPIPTTSIYTNKLNFRIPFHYDSAELSRLGAREIRLYVSRDRGKVWQQVQAVSPDAGKFNFQAATDGEYWFLVRTLDSKNQLHPALSVVDPGLQVIVDSTVPRLVLELRQPSPGNVLLLWNASDTHLDLSQLRLEYMQPGSLDWQPVSVVPKPTGQTSWKLPQGGVVSVRGSIADLAHNTAHDQVQLRILPGSDAVPRPGSPEMRQPVAGPAGDPRDNLALTMPDKFPSPSALRTEEPAAQQPSGVPQIGRPQEAETALPTTSPRNSFISLKPEDKAAVGNPAAVAPDPARRVWAGRKRVVDSKRFQIGYNLEDVGPSGISSVDLYITEDNGANWFHYGSDDDNQSPIFVEVPCEGTYGFALGVRSGAGLSSEPPQKGEPPAIVVVVDQTAPELELLPVQQGVGKNVNKLLVTWKCEDDNLAERPVSLFYSSSGQAPWLPVTGPLENTGSFVWNISQGVPVKFYLRIEARDLAGHVQTIDSPQPIVIDLSRPTAKIIDVESPVPAAVPR